MEGPPCIVDFIAADEYVQVTFTDGCDLSNMTGKGKVSINKNGDKHKVWFNNVKLEKDGVQYYLREGEVLGKIDDLPPIKLTPEFFQERGSMVLSRFTKNNTLQL